jgi:hypothetical protein
MENARFSPRVGQNDRMVIAGLKLQIDRTDAARRYWIFMFHKNEPAVVF